MQKTKKAPNNAFDENLNILNSYSKFTSRKEKNRVAIVKRVTNTVNILFNCVL